MKSKLLFIICLLSFSISEAQIKDKKDSGYKIEVNLPKSVGKTLHLAKFSNGSPYSIDSVTVSPKGKAIFRSNEQLPQGQYLLYKRPDLQMELLLGDEQKNIRIKLNEDDLQNSKITGSKDTELYWNYIRHINKENEEIKNLSQKLDKIESQTGKEVLVSQIVSKENQILEYMNSLAKQYEDRWFGSFLKGTIPIKKPHGMANAITNQDYLRKHYFDNINFNDPRLWNTSYFPKMIKNYLSNHIPQIPDTVAYEASKLVSKTVNDSISFKEMLSYILNDAMQSKYMGMENVWAKLAEDYILDKNIPWIEKEKEAQIRSLHEALKLNRIGMKATNLEVVSLDGDTINTNDIEAQFTILYFYNTTCGHCKETTTILRNNIYPKYKDHKLRIIAFNLGNDEKSWREYISNNNLSEWTNCFDPTYKSAYWMYYDTSAVPMIYVLDKNKRIIARKVDGENLDKLLGYYIQ